MEGTTISKKGILVKKSTEARADEKLAIELLKEYLGRYKDLEFRCERNLNDPPDIVVIWENGKRWGVEVTQIRKSEDKLYQLERFGKELEKMTESIRKRDYFLGLGADPIYLQGEMAPRYDKKWKEKTKEAIWKHIRSDKNDILKLPGVFFYPKNTHGRCWRVNSQPRSF